MNLPRYQLAGNDKLTTFEFVSEGPKGRIQKLVQFTSTNLKDVYNLAFGDKDKTTGKIDDTIISNNGDSEKVLATVTATIYAFTDKHPDAFIYATGSTKSRTRLYRMGITKYLSEVETDFIIFGETKEGWDIFEKDANYFGFLIQRKNY
ncbi:MAG: hypothetical protein A2275_05240 [Bacteroidetes bacterium RIFOXYA12_FULL_35_11]|nr:MAG: hypothetical protein A2X01_18495 [Bacteroidetes bacterium GWF2_35_48]OFY74310.1 MAG: hypothetical protein A2275_05240 [Bacteroidetes bacterium RIFOXYA12_FULL_35_11]